MSGSLSDDLRGKAVAWLKAPVYAARRQNEIDGKNQKYGPHRSGTD